MGWGSSTRRGGGRKLRAPPRKFVFLGFGRQESGMSRDFCRDVPDPWRCSKSLCKKTSCAFFVPYLGILFLDFPDFPGFSRFFSGIFPFPLSRPINLIRSTNEEQS